MEKQNRDRAEIDIDHANKHLEKLTADNRHLKNDLANIKVKVPSKEFEIDFSFRKISRALEQITMERLGLICSLDSMLFLVF